ncbi:MAG: hypothetical protein RL326_272 [Pseudomonadota bacterium]
MSRVVAMARVLIVFLLGLSAGAAGTVVFLPRAPQQVATIVTPAPAAVVCEDELARQRARIQELESRASAMSHDAASHAVTHSGGHDDSSAEQDASSEEKQREALSWRVSAIEKFVPLTEEQRNRLVAKFQEENRAGQAGEESRAEKLEEILGDDNARYYRDQVKAAFERVQNEETEKEVLWLSRQLNLAPEQERSMRAVFLDVEKTVESEFGSSSHGSKTSPQERVKAMIAESKRRRALRGEKLQAVLPPDQYQAYLRSEAESAASDVEVFHDPGK